MGLKEKLRFKIIEFLYNHKLFGFHKKCWATLVIYSMYGDWDSVIEATKCGYCGSCMTDEEWASELARRMNDRKMS